MNRLYRRRFETETFSKHCCRCKTLLFAYRHGKVKLQLTHENVVDLFRSAVLSAEQFVYAYRGQIPTPPAFAKSLLPTAPPAVSPAVSTFGNFAVRFGGKTVACAKTVRPCQPDKKLQIYRYHVVLLFYVKFLFPARKVTTLSSSVAEKVLPATLLSKRAKPSVSSSESTHSNLLLRKTATLLHRKSPVPDRDFANRCWAWLQTARN